MGPLLFRVALLAVGFAVGEVGVTALASGDPVWIPQIALAIALLTAGSVAFMGLLLAERRNQGTEVRRDE